MEKMKKALIVFMVLAIIGVVFIVADINFGKNYVQSNYIRTLNLKCSYDKLIQKYGEPQKELIANIEGEPDFKVWLVYYDGVIVSYHYDEECEQVTYYMCT